MPETLTESFCERCGTRYTFESAAPKGKRLGKIKVLSKGFVNFVSNDDRSLDEAFAEARSDEQREQTSQQLDAFHQTFQFCMSCRQYTCANCWNDVESRCLSCAPLFGSETLGGAFPAALDPLARLGLGQPTPEIHAANGHHNGDAELPALGEPAADSAWPTADRATDGGPAEVPWPELAALPAGGGDSGEPSAEAGAPETIEPEALAPEAAASEAAASADDEQADAAASEAVVPGMAAWEAARSAFEDQPEAAAPETIGDDAVDEDVALAVAEAERVRLAAAEAEQARQAAAEADAELDRQRQAAEAEAERLRQAAEAEAQREREVAAAAEAEAKQQRQVAEAAAEAERQRLAAQVQADYLEAAEASEAETKAERQAALEAEALRQRQAVEADLQREREAAAEADRQRQAAEEAELQRQAAEDAQRQRQAAEEAERQRQAEALAAAAALAAAPPPIRDDRVGAPIWQIVAPETPPTHEPGPLDVPPAILSPQPPLPSAPSATNGGAQMTNGGAGAVNGAPQPPPAGASEWPSPATTPPPQWPMPRAVTAPQWPVGQGTARGANDDLWAASSQDVLSKAGQGVQACTSCGLPLSASARFCRRCGTQQH